MTHSRFLGTALAALALSTAAIPSALPAQEPAPAQVGEAQLRAFASSYLVVVTARDDFQRAMGHSHDEQERDRLRQTLKERLAEILVEKELTQEEYERITLLISIDGAMREQFDKLLEELSGGGASAGK